ncbi:endo-1,4-beta-xylanase [candidate division KSB1 bacterium]|nr:endo-1,4-beta-xylanase [candidate division KSB1 bacterium]
MNRRSFIKKTCCAGLGTTVLTQAALSNALVLTDSKTEKPTEQGELVFTPAYVQRGEGPHLLDWAYASDINHDSFYSNISSSKDGVKISDVRGQNKFGINVRWNVEGFGYIYITADNGGEFYELPRAGSTTILNLNFELAKSRVLRNRKRLKELTQNGWEPSRQVTGYQDIADFYYQDANRKQGNQELCGKLSQQALYFAMLVGESMELDRARFDIRKNGYRPDFFIGCDARGYYQMDQDLFLERFTGLFNYATITHYLLSGYFQDFEPIEGRKQFDLRTAVLKTLKKHNITVEGRPLFWFYRTTTPDWLRNKKYDDLLRYVESHTRTVMSHYGDQMYAWEIVNELHDWANEVQLSPEQTVELTKLACDVARDTNPKVNRLINNCCPFAEYVQLKKWGELDAKYPQRTPHKFMRDLVDAGVDFTITGQQMYFPYRDLSDTILLVERFREFGKPVQLTEVGAPSGPSRESLLSGTSELPKEPYIWRRYWDEELQADWLEGVYTLAYSRPWIEAANWYDFVDPHSFIINGGLLRSPKGEPKAAYNRLLKLQNEWKSLG